MPRSADATRQPDVLDLAIVGGGLAGLYVGWKADARRYPRRAIFDAAPALGSRPPSARVRYGTAVFDEALGARCVEWAVQPLVRQLFGQLGLEVEDLAAATGAARGRLGDAAVLASMDDGSAVRSPFAAWRLAILAVLRRVCASLPPPLRLESSPEDEEAWLAELGEPHVAWIRTEAALLMIELGVRVRLADVGIWSLLRSGGILSRAALSALVEEGGFYHFAHRNISAAESLVFWIRVLQSEPSIRSLPGGVQAVTDRLAARAAAAGAGLRVGHTLTRLSAVRAAGERLVALQFSTDGGMERVVVHARHVVLALPQLVLLRLATAFPTDVRDILGMILPTRVSRRFFLVQAPAWAGDAGTPGDAGAPASETHYFSTADRARGAVLGARPEEGSADRPLVDWAHVPHQGGEACFWRPGAAVTASAQRLAAFELADAEALPGPPRIHVCGCAYSDFQGFLEGALRSAEAVLDALVVPASVAGDAPV